MEIPLRPRTIRTRLTLLYAALLLGFGIALLAAAAFLVFRRPILATFAPTLAVFGGPGNPPPLPDPAQLHSLALVPTENTVRALLVEASIGLVLTVACSAALGWFMAGRALAPLRTIDATTRRISERNLHERLRLGSKGRHDEATQLADTINGLLQRLESAFEAQRRFIANASHELRTPLAMMRTSVDVAVAKPPPVPPPVTALAGKLYEALDSAEHLLEGLLTLARAHNGLTAADKAEVDLAGLVHLALDSRAPLIAEKAITVQREIRDVSVAADVHLLTVLLENLVDNAARHNEPGGWLRISIRETADGEAVITVENSGKLLRQDDVAQLGRPFQRPGAQRTAAHGHGLGLSIASAIAEAHGGKLVLTARAEGGMKAEASV